MLLPAIKLLRYGLGNPVSRQILSIGLSFCDSCRMSRLQHALMIYLERARAYTLRCRLYSSMLCALINLGLYTFDVDRRSLVSVAFSGGEPLMARDFFDVAVKVKEEGMYLAIATNGTLITRRVAKRLKALGTDYVEVSLDFADARSHDAFRGVKGAFNKALEGVQNCVAEGIYTGIATTATKLNLWQIQLRRGRNLHRHSNNGD